MVLVLLLLLVPVLLLVLLLPPPLLPLLLLLLSLLRCHRPGWHRMAVRLRSRRIGENDRPSRWLKAVTLLNSRNPRLCRCQSVGAQNEGEPSFSLDLLFRIGATEMALEGRPANAAATRLSRLRFAPTPPNRLLRLLVQRGRQSCLSAPGGPVGTSSPFRKFSVRKDAFQSEQTRFREKRCLAVRKRP